MYLPVCSGTPEIPVDDDDCHQYTDGVHDESKEQVLSDER